MHAHPSKQNIKVAADAAIFTVENNQLKILLIKMKKAPFVGEWALPGGLLGDGETSCEAVNRILTTQTGVKNVYLEQLMTFDNITRDQLGRVISIAWFALIPSLGFKLKTTEKYGDVRFWPVKKLPKLAYDHATIAKMAISRLRAKLEYANVAWSLLPNEFTLGELQETYESILSKRLDKRNFQKKYLAMGLIKESGKIRGGAAHRPAKLYQFAKFV
jgi:8-oxo-dGTP diphosphatase